MSETKETEPGEAQATPENADDQPADALEASDAAAASGEERAASDQARAVPATKKKKKAREAEGPESIRDRNERIRAEAAEKRRARREREQGSAPRRNLDASEVVDDALARSTHAAAGFLRRHFSKVQWVIVAGLAGWIAWEVYSWRQSRGSEQATHALFKALSADTGKVGDASDASAGQDDARRSFTTDEERLKTAKSEYQLAVAAADRATLSALAELGAAGVAYDLGEYKEAQAAYEKVKQSPAFEKDSDLRGRALEGLGMALEAQKNHEGALKAFRELANMDTANFAALGMYHQARLLKEQGKNEDALKLLEKAGEKLVLLKETPAAIKYLRMSVLELYEALDSKKAIELQRKLMPADLLKQLQQSLGGAFPGGALPMPVEPAPEQTPEAPAPEPAPTPEAPAPAETP